MKLSPGQNLLHYKLVEKIGEGGMGVVWRAQDTTLNRDVAIKVLPEGFSGDPDRLARFEREAKLLASLNHPNIAGIYGIHNTDGTQFLAMELVDGDELAQVLSRGALSRDEALRVGLQIAQAFEVAHDSGVIHRDLKPANVKLTSTGQVKVLDFGLAKALSADPSNPGTSLSLSPTMTSTGSIAGALIGTAAYMSPEQAKGKQVDRRADIWSFGVVLHEMLTGRRMFEGETISETLAAVLMKDVDLAGLPGDTPPAIRKLIERCLQRDPQKRMRDIGDARIRIEEALNAPDEPRATQAVATPRGRWTTLLPWGLAAIAAIALAYVLLTEGERNDPGPVMRFTLALSEDQPIDTAPLPMLAISPDGTRIAYVGVHNNQDVIFLRYVHQSEATPLRGTEDADSPFFSPDGDWIGFLAQGKLKKISILGGPPTILCSAPNLRGASWGTDGTIVFAPDRSSGLMRVSEAGGDPEWVSESKALEDTIDTSSERWPQFLPGNQTIIFTSAENNSSYNDAEIVALTIKDKSRKTLVKGGTFARFVPPGFLVYARENTLFAARFDPKTLEIRGGAVPVLENVNGASLYGSKHLAFSRNGTLIFLGGTTNYGLESLVWLDPEGHETSASKHELNYSAAKVSPDGQFVALEIISPGEEISDIWILELERDILTRLTFEDTSDQDPIWSPDGQWITFASIREDHPVHNLYRMRADGTGEVERLLVSDRRQIATNWSPDSKVLAFMELGGPTSGDILLYRPDEDPKVEPFQATNFGEWDPKFSPNGRWISYASDASGQLELYVRSTSGEGRQVKISTTGASVSVWGIDGKELLYRSADGKLMAVSVTVNGDDFRPDLPRELTDFAAPPHSFLFDIAPDGRILSYKDGSSGGAFRREPTVVVNWHRELEEKVPK